MITKVDCLFLSIYRGGGGIYSLPQFATPGSGIQQTDKPCISAGRSSKGFGTDTAVIGGLTLDSWLLKCRVCQPAGYLVSRW